ncbi:hypothetical protein TNCV_519011 [Trichonephila clavipes]|nr:hypothetical protein TNCV_519011 [Trichonephila clavipes]
MHLFFRSNARANITPPRKEARVDEEGFFIRVLFTRGAFLFDTGSRKTHLLSGLKSEMSQFLFAVIRCFRVLQRVDPFLGSSPVTVVMDTKEMGGGMCPSIVAANIRGRETLSQTANQGALLDAAESCDMAAVDFQHHENPPTWAGVEPGTLGAEGQRQTSHATRPGRF